MKKLTSNSATFVTFSILFVLFISAFDLYAQPGPSFSASYDFFPYMKLSDPDTSGGAAFLKDGEIRVATLNLRASYPLVFSQGRTVLINEIAYQRFDLDFQKWQEGATRPEHVYAVEYNLMVQHVLSKKWTLLGFLTPGLASDFKADISSDDFTIQAVLVFIRQYSQKLSIGYGAAYANTFGEPFPLPILALEWNNGKNMKLSTILPVSSEFWYRANPLLDLGLSLKVAGNQYRGDPDIYNVSIPMMRYSVGTFGPSIKFRFSKGMSIGIDSGITFLRRFEFFDNEKKKEVNDYTLKNTVFVRFNLQIGG